MKSFSQIDKKKRNLFFKFELFQKVLKYIFFNKSLKMSTRWETFLKIKKKFSKTFLINSCIFSNTTKSIQKEFRLSSIFLRNFIRKAEICGIFKKSW